MRGCKRLLLSAKLFRRKHAAHTPPLLGGEADVSKPDVQELWPITTVLTCAFSFIPNPLLGSDVGVGPRFRPQQYDLVPKQGPPTPNTRAEQQVWGERKESKSVQEANVRPDRASNRRLPSEQTGGVCRLLSSETPRAEEELQPLLMPATPVHL